MKTFQFESKIRHVGTMPNFSANDIKNEPMLFGCTRGMALTLGGTITNAFFASLPDDWKDCDIIADSRVHMLMPGWYPCIPGWHLDDVPRSRADGQPDHDDPEYKAEHLLCCLGDASLTLFALGNIELDEPELGTVIYGDWHDRIEEKIARNELELQHAKSGALIEFDWRTFHRGSIATKNGWRWFMRITRNTRRPVTNELRRQTQVYLPAPTVGW